MKIASIAKHRTVGPMTYMLHLHPDGRMLALRCRFDQLVFGMRSRLTDTGLHDVSAHRGGLRYGHLTQEQAGWPAASVRSKFAVHERSFIKVYDRAQRNLFDDVVGHGAILALSSSRAKPS